MKRKVLVTIGVIALAVLGFAGYRVYDTRLSRDNVVAAVKDSMQLLRESLAAEVAGNGELDVDKRAAAADVNVSRLRNMKTSRVTALADAADDVLVTSREIMRRQVALERGYRNLLASSDLLVRHIQADRGANDWTREAVRLKGAVDKDLRDYRIAVESYGTLLESFPASQARLASYLPPASLIEDDLLRQARQHALDVYTRVDQNTKRVSTIKAYH